MGGIAGVIWSNVVIENCLSAGNASSKKMSSSGRMQIGSIIGGRGGDSSDKNITITNCFWTEGVGGWNASGEVIGDITALYIADSQIVEMNESTLIMLYNLMNQAGSSSFVIVHLNGGRIGNSADDGMILHRNHIPVPEKEGHSFSFWCTDSDCNGKCDVNSTGSCESSDLYAEWTPNNYSITFLTLDDDNNIITKHLPFGQPIEFPENITKEGHSLIGWDNTTSTVPGYDLIIKAQWAINNYTLTFDFDNGTAPSVRTIPFNGNIAYPDDPKMERHLFTGWDNNITRMPSRGLTINAQWVINNYTLTFDFGNGTDPSVRTIPFNGNIAYPDDPMKENYEFIGWNSIITRMPA